MTVAEKVLDRRAIHYLRKNKAKPKSNTLQKLAKELGIKLPSPREIIEKLKRGGLSYRRISIDIYGNPNHISSFINAHKLGHSLRFEAYQKLLNYAYKRGLIKEKAELEEILKKVGLGE